jgi:hypothetical protein
MNRNKHGIEYLLFLIIVLFCNSCEFEPSEVYNRSVTDNSTPAMIQIIELNLDDDTVYLYSERVIQFKFHCLNQKIKRISFILDWNEMSFVNSDTGTLYALKYKNLDEGVHTLVLKLYTGSGTGSIAEHLGGEGYFYSKSWVIIVRKSYQSSCRDTVINGLLHLSWDAYKGSDFKEYVIFKQFDFDQVKEIKRVKKAEFIDSTYVGEGGKYIISVISSNTNIVAYTFITLNREIPKVYFKATNQNEYSVCWDRSRYYNAVESYDVLHSYYQSSSYSLDNSTNNPNDTVFNFTSVSFGDKINLKLRLVPKKTNLFVVDHPSYYESELETYIGYSFIKKNKSINYIRQVSKTEFIYAEYYDSLVKYSVTLNKETQRIGYPSNNCGYGNFRYLCASPSGNFITSYVGCNHDVMLTNSANLQSYTIKDLSSMVGSNNSEIPVSDNGFCMVNNVFANGFYIYDFNNSTILAHYLKNGFPKLISKNGEYLYLSGDSLRLIKYADSTFKPIWRGRSGSGYGVTKFFNFDGLDPNRLVIWDGITFSIKNCADFSSIYEYALTDEYLANIDYYNQEILTYNNGHIYVRNYTDGAIKYNIPVLHLNYGSNNKYYLINHTIFSESGVLYHIN